MWGPTVVGGGSEEEKGEAEKSSKETKGVGDGAGEEEEKKGRMSACALVRRTVFILFTLSFSALGILGNVSWLWAKTHTHKLQTLFFSPFPLLYSRTPVWKCPILDLNTPECLYLIQSVWKVSVCCRICCLTSHHPSDTLQTGIKVWPKVAETVTLTTYSLTPDKWTVYIKTYREDTEEKHFQLKNISDDCVKHDFWFDVCIITTLSCYIFIYHNPTVLIYLLGRENASLHIIKSDVKRRAKSWKWGDRFSSLQQDA